MQKHWREHSPLIASIIAGTCVCLCVDTHTHTHTEKLIHERAVVLVDSYKPELYSWKRNSLWIKTTFDFISNAELYTQPH